MLHFLSIVLLIAPVLCGTISNSPQSTVNHNELVTVQNHPNLGLLSTNCGYISSNRLFGQEAEVYEFPWMVLLSYNTDVGNKLLCVGTLISERYVLTAARCVSTSKIPSIMGLNGVILGEHNLKTDPDCEGEDAFTICGDKVMNVTIEEVIPHPGYSVASNNSKTYTDDIALLRLTQPVDFKQESVGPICLPITPELQRDSLASQHGEIAGWGVGYRNMLLPVLSKFLVNVINNEECQAAFVGISAKKQPQITSKHMCIRSTNVFRGDLGGPLMKPSLLDGKLRQVQRGIASFGPISRESNIPEVYTNIGFYMQWILDTIRK